MKFRKVLQAIEDKSRATRDALALQVLMWIEKKPNEERIGLESELSRANAAPDSASSEHAQPISARESTPWPGSDQ